MTAGLRKEYEKMRDHLQGEYFVLDKYILEGRYLEDHEQIIMKMSVLSAILKQLDKAINPPKTNLTYKTAGGIPQRQIEELY